MDLYEIKAKQLVLVKPVALSGSDGEKKLQQLIEANLDAIFELELIKSEFEIQRKEIDTFAFDRQNKSVVIIEYKKSDDYGVIDQGFTYLSLVHENKDYLRLAVKEALGREVEIDWSSTRIMFIAKSFRDFQISASSIRGVPFELWEYGLFANNCLSLNEIRTKQTRTTFNSLLKAQSAQVQKIAEEIKVYDLEYHLDGTTAELRELFSDYSKAIRGFGEGVQEHINQKSGITYRNNKVSFARFEFRAKSIDVLFKEKQLGFVDPKKLSVDVRKNRWGFERRVKIVSRQNFEDILYLLRQAYETTDLAPRSESSRGRIKSEAIQ
ncbi:MAG: hypothetical protein ABSC42_09350 [Tepidisphaeraceae bacterium]|jgi:predicted transport protein